MHIWPARRVYLVESFGHWLAGVRAAAKRSGIYEPMPEFGADEVPTDMARLAAYGERYRAALAKKGLAPDKPETEEDAIRRGRAAWGRWVRLARRYTAPAAGRRRA